MGYNRTMKNTYQLTKKEAETLFGGPEAIAKALGYTSETTVYNWPPVLSLGVSDRVRGAALRMGLLVVPPTVAPAPRPARPVKRTRWLAWRAA